MLTQPLQVTCYPCSRNTAATRSAPGADPKTFKSPIGMRSECSLAQSLGDAATHSGVIQSIRLTSTEHQLAKAPAADRAHLLKSSWRRAEVANTSYERSSLQSQKKTENSSGFSGTLEAAFQGVRQVSAFRLDQKTACLELTSLLRERAR